jgi:hypothetical protein
MSIAKRVEARARNYDLEEGRDANGEIQGGGFCYRVRRWAGCDLLCPAASSQT